MRVGNGGAVGGAGVRVRQRPPGSPSTASGPGRQDEPDRVRAHLAAACPRYWPELDGPLEPVLRSCSERPASRTYAFDVVGPRSRRSVLVKVPARTGHYAAPSRARPAPRLMARADLATKSEREFEALRMIEAAFGAPQGHRFITVPALDVVTPLGALVTERIEVTDLRRRSRGAMRLPGAPGPVGPGVWEGVGAWLRTFHGIPVDRPEHRMRRDGVVAAFGSFCAYLADELGRPGYFSELEARFARAADHDLPELLPLGLAHGDFAWGNVIISPDGRVGALDTVAGWRAPVYEDLAYLFVGIRCSRTQIVTRGWARSRRELVGAENAVLRGYFGDDRPHRAAIRLFLALQLVEKWSAEVYRVGTGGRRAAAFGVAAGSWFRGRLGDLLGTARSGWTIGA